MVSGRNTQFELWPSHTPEYTHALPQRHYIHTHTHELGLGVPEARLHSLEHRGQVLSHQTHAKLLAACSHPSTIDNHQGTKTCMKFSLWSLLSVHFQPNETFSHVRTWVCHGGKTVSGFFFFFLKKSTVLISNCILTPGLFSGFYSWNISRQCTHRPQPNRPELIKTKLHIS